jgi:uncharacterized membrane protein YkvA (DUF1232 family)
MVAAAGTSQRPMEVGMAEQIKKPSSAKQKKPRASAKKPPTTSAAKKTSAARSAAKDPADTVPAISKAQVEEQSERYKRKADKYRNDPKKTERLLKEAEKKARKNPGPISARLQDLATLLRLVRAYFSKEYTEVPWETIALAIGANAYYVSPIDLIPDFIPVAGYLDDAAVIGFVIASAANDLHNFREWEAHQQLGT